MYIYFVKKKTKLLPDALCFFKMPHKSSKKELDVITLTYFVNS